MNYSEKITVNLNVVDLGQIDLLVDKGVYSNRTDFIKTAIRNQLENQNYLVKDSIIKDNFTIGVICYSKADLERRKANSEILNIKVVGMLLLKDDITEDLLREVVHSIEVKGIIKANQQLKNLLSEITKKG